MTEIVLASGSRTRAKLLEGAGVSFAVKTAGVDEESVRDSLRAEGASAADVAVALGEMKAISVSRNTPGALVIGGDQMLECNGVWFEKPRDRAHAEAHLKTLSGRKHILHSSVVVVLDSTRIWHVLDSVEVEVRPLSDAFIQHYLDQVGDQVFDSVGAYQLEGLGAQLFNRVKGDFFTVLGLPLLPLLEFLRVRGVLER